MRTARSRGSSGRRSSSRSRSPPGSPPCWHGTTGCRRRLVDRRAGGPRRLVQLAAARGDPRPPDAVADGSTPRSPSIPLGLVVPFAAYRDDPPRPPPRAGAHRSRRRPGELLRHGATWERCGRVRRAALRGDADARRAVGARPARGRALRWRRIELAAAAQPPRRGASRSATASASPRSLAVVRASGMAWWVYVVGVAWGGGALSLLRSFAEHRYADGGTRIGRRAHGAVLLAAVPQQQPPPHPPRAARPCRGSSCRRSTSDSTATSIAAAGAGLYRGYGDVARRYLFRPFDVAAHPSG